MALLEPDVRGEGTAGLQCSCTRASATPGSSGALSVYRDVQSRSKSSPCSCQSLDQGGGRLLGRAVLFSWENECPGHGGAQISIPHVETLRSLFESCRGRLWLARG